METIDIALSGSLGGFSIDAAFEAPMRGITALFGPSGCGKTSILRQVAGLNRLPGHVRVGGETWQDEHTFRPPHKRPVGYVFQEASLFPHLSVRGNLTYGQRRARGGAEAIRFDEVVALLGLTRLVERDPAHLSGGERQRVSIGRALLSQPRLLLMDEPLSALDRMARDEILPYFEALHARLSIPILLVTHDIGEVERLADHLVALKGGRVVSSGPLGEVLADPASPLGERRDFAAILPGRVARLEPDGIAALQVFGVEILVVTSALSVGERVRVRIAAGDVSIARARAADTSILNAVPARIEGIDPFGEAEAHLRLSLRGDPRAAFRARLSRRSVERLALREGEEVIAQIKGVSLAATR
ncbi:molybdenum ABC transporter ATP-binding protein [Aureimonas populi]|uniref:Molybdenum ABC transporter ATP-binding protein n=1 Tax=Aureimonas populi TaxID=1701758 RepID=A0ABW5CMG9_9HYPH|nr:molybdenum ABC transporter ATP-binding protein [Aureimonas populi]